MVAVRRQRRAWYGVHDYHSTLPKMKKLISLYLAWFAFGCGATAIIGKIVGNSMMQSWVDGGTPMAISTAASVIALAVAFILRTQCKNGHGHRSPNVV